MRLLVLSTLLLAACNGPDDPVVDDTDGTSTGGCANNPDADVPEDLRCLWELTYNGCTTARGGAGKQVYYQMQGQVDADGNMTGTEKIWWFYPDAWNATDCVDSLSVSGGKLFTDLGRLGCETCEEGYEVRREVTVDNCVLGYNILFEEDDEGLKQTLLIDTKTSNDEPNEDNKILVLHRTRGDNGGESTDEYARGNMTPTGAEHGAPYTFTWLGSACLSR